MSIPSPPSVRLLKDAYMKLLDASIGETSQMDVIKALARRYDRYCDFKNIRTRSAGRIQFVEMHLVMPDHLSIKHAHHIANTLKVDIACNIAESEVTVHIEPRERNYAFDQNNEACPYTGH